MLDQPAQHPRGNARWAAPRPGSLVPEGATALPTRPGLVDQLEAPISETAQQPDFPDNAGHSCCRGGKNGVRRVCRVTDDDPMDDEMVERFLADGFVKIEGAVPPQQVADVAAREAEPWFDPAG